MNKVLALALLAAGTVHAQEALTDIQTEQATGAYLRDSRGAVTRSGTGMCWRGGSWTPADALPGCDGALIPPVANPIAPPLIAAPPAPVAAAAPEVPRPCDFSYTLGGQVFAFGGSTLGQEARRQLERDFAPRLAECGTLTSIRVTGHTDRIGTPTANRKLSERRAAAVATHLNTMGVSAPVETLGAGSDVPLSTCAGSLPRKALLNCLAPDRRVVIDVRGSAK